MSHFRFGFLIVLTGLAVAAFITYVTTVLIVGGI